MSYGTLQQRPHQDESPGGGHEDDVVDSLRSDALLLSQIYLARLDDLRRRTLHLLHRAHRLLLQDRSSSGSFGLGAVASGRAPAGNYFLTAPPPLSGNSLLAVGGASAAVDPGHSTVPRRGSASHVNISIGNSGNFLSGNEISSNGSLSARNAVHGAVDSADFVPGGFVFGNSDLDSRSVSPSSVTRDSSDPVALSGEMRKEFARCFRSAHLLRGFAAGQLNYLRRERIDTAVQRGVLSVERQNDIIFFLSELSISRYLEKDADIVDGLRKNYAACFTFGDENMAEFEMLALADEEVEAEAMEHLEALMNQRRGALFPSVKIELIAGLAVLLFSLFLLLPQLNNTYFHASPGLVSPDQEQPQLPSLPAFIFSPGFVFSTEFHIFRGAFFIVCWLWSFVLTIKLWISARINFIVLLDLDRRQEVFSDNALQLRSVMTVVASLATILWCANTLAYIHLSNSTQFASFQAFPPLFFCLSLIVAFIYFLGKFIQQTVQYEGYHALPELLVRLFGISTTSFFAAIVSDYLTSSTPLLGDIANMICYVVSGDWQLKHVSHVCPSSFALHRVVIPILYCYPLFLRIVQSLERFLRVNRERHCSFLLNACKYGIALAVIIASAIRADEIWSFNSNDGARQIFFSIFIISAITTFLWDVIMDWGFFYHEDESSGSHVEFLSCQLRKRRMFYSMWWYPCGIIIDFALRFIWILNIVLIGSEDVGYEYDLLLFSPLIAMAEIFRRSMWSFFRLENEHLHNRIGYRSTRFVPLLLQKSETSLPPTVDINGNSHVDTLFPTTQPSSLYEKQVRQMESSRLLTVVQVTIFVCLVRIFFLSVD